MDLPRAFGSCEFAQFTPLSLHPPKRVEYVLVIERTSASTLTSSRPPNHQKSMKEMAASCWVLELRDFQRSATD